MQLVRLSTEGHKLRPRSPPIGRFTEDSVSQRQGLVGAKHDTARLARRHSARFFARQKFRDRFWRSHLGALFKSTLVNVGGYTFQGDPGVFEPRAPHRTLGGQNQRLLRTPERHGQATGCRRRSASSLSTAAAVSSIDRRVTSISGQLWRAQSLREKVTSSATAWRSTYW